MSLPPLNTLTQTYKKRVQFRSVPGNQRGHHFCHGILGGLFYNNKHAHKQIIFLTPVGRISLMDILTVHPPTPPFPVFIHPALQVEISGSFLHLNGEWNKPLIEAQKARSLSLNDKWLRGRQGLHLHGIYFHGEIFFPPSYFHYLTSRWKCHSALRLIKGSLAHGDFMFTC